jgi:hypothetical protein
LLKVWRRFYAEKLITETSADIHDGTGELQIPPTTQDTQSDDVEPQGSGSNTPDDSRRKREEARRQRQEAQRIREEQRKQEAAKLAAARASKGKPRERTDAAKQAQLKKKEYERRRRERERRELERQKAEREMQGEEEGEEEEEEEEDDDEAISKPVKLVDLNMNTPAPRYVNELTVLRSTVVDLGPQEEEQVNPLIGDE